MTDSEFSDDVAVVTGATSGIGLGVTKALLARGATVIASGPGAAELAETAANLADLSGKMITLAADLSGVDGWRGFIEDVRKSGHTVSIFVHSASPARAEAQTVLDVSEAQWDAMLNTNLRSGFFVGRELAKDMIKSATPGRMLYITSLHRHTPRNLPHYSASKAGQFMIVRELARALGEKGIRVNGIAPGAIPGGGFSMDADSAAEFSKRIPLGRPGSPDDIARMAMALLSNEISGYVTGEVVAVDGGLDLYNWIDRPSTDA